MAALESETRQSYLVFACGSSWYAVPAEAAAEVVTFPELTRVPGSPPHLLGVFAHRGEVIPVVDMSLLVGGVTAGSRRAVLVRLPRGTLALTASSVAGVSPVTGALEPLGPSGVHVHLRGPGKSGARDVAVIDPEGLFDHLSQGG
ncbi:chemotaxis protein CheW [Corallococcus praedator]|uniref:Chemotaxis protein CheW n=1 Tax=Corallococcus praedator TaxID=2316724 RepID=A0ABX9QD80_9BACT|nr:MULTISPECIES: chemotaxis protein CheW [Corallococcus]RKH19173.1 chemotaxis protein CheW [Corallococcus sp. CA047B]RKH27510.1 chemotaxis protein CheW [Corallococcus sp. CA031C]RKI02700.1 chemotaxis protein CheW [Corallococcus praedator]